MRRGGDRGKGRRQCAEADTPSRPAQADEAWIPSLDEASVEAGTYIPERGVGQDFSPVQHTIVLRRVYADARTAHFYVLTLERDLFGNLVVTRQWGRVGTAGFATEE